MRGRRAHKYGTGQFSPDGIISLCMGILGWILFLISVVQSVLTAGNASVVFGYLMIVSFVLALWGAVFSVMAWKAEEGTLTIKRVTVLVSFLLLFAECALLVVYIL